MNFVPGAGEGVNAAKFGITKLPEALTIGKNVEEGIHVYLGIKNTVDVYAGITGNVMRLRQNTLVASRSRRSHKVWASHADKPAPSRKH